MPHIRLMPVEPIGARQVTGLGHGPNGCRPVTITLHEYPADDVQRGTVLAELRQADPWLSTRDVARATRLSAYEVNGLEHGKFRFADAASRDLYVAAIADASRVAAEVPK